MHTACLLRAQVSALLFAGKMPHKMSVWPAAHLGLALLPLRDAAARKKVGGEVLVRERRPRQRGGVFAQRLDPVADFRAL